jgi:hypothetical protein
MDEPLNAFLPLSNASNAASTFPTILTIPNNHPVVAVPGLPPHTFDEPASIAAVTKDFSHVRGDCPTISEADQSQGDIGFPVKVEGPAKIVPGPLIANNRLPLSTLENIPKLNGNSMEHKLLGAPEIPVVPTVLANSVLAKALGLLGLLGLPSIPVVPGVVSVPATPRQASTRSRN